MQLNITARHLDLTPAISDYVHRKIEKAEKYSDSIIWAQAILTVEKHRHIAEIVIHTPGNTFRTKGESTDLYSAVDLAAHKLELHLSREKDKKKNHRSNKNSNDIAALTPANEHSEQNHPSAIKEFKSVALQNLSLNQAIKILVSEGHSFLPFVNDRTNRFNIIYKKKQNEYGLIEAEIS